MSITSSDTPVSPSPSGISRDQDRAIIVWFCLDGGSKRSFCQSVSNQSFIFGITPTKEEKKQFSNRVTKLTRLWNSKRGHFYTVLISRGFDKLASEAEQGKFIPQYIVEREAVARCNRRTEEPPTEEDLPTNYPDNVTSGEPKEEKKVAAVVYKSSNVITPVRTSSTTAFIMEHLLANQASGKKIKPEGEEDECKYPANVDTKLYFHISHPSFLTIKQLASNSSLTFTTSRRTYALFQS
jgi:hypothetical protein